MNVTFSRVVNGKRREMTGRVIAEYRFDRVVIVESRDFIGGWKLFNVAK